MLCRYNTLEGTRLKSSRHHLSVNVQPSSLLETRSLHSEHWFLPGEEPRSCGMVFRAPRKEKEVGITHQELYSLFLHWSCSKTSTVSWEDWEYITATQHLLHEQPCSPQHRREKYSVWLFGSLAAPTQGFGRYKYLCLNSAALQPRRSLWLHPPAPRGGCGYPQHLGALPAVYFTLCKPAAKGRCSMSPFTTAEGGDTGLKASLILAGFGSLQPSSFSLPLLAGSWNTTF